MSVIHPKDKAEKALEKVTYAFQRYTKEGCCHAECLPDLLESLDFVETMVDQLKEGR